MSDCVPTKSKKHEVIFTKLPEVFTKKLNTLENFDIPNEFTEFTRTSTQSHYPSY